MLFKLSNLNSNLALTLGYLNPALNNLAQENKFMLPSRFEQATISLVVIDNSKVIHPTICSGEECRLIS